MPLPPLQPPARLSARVWGTIKGSVTGSFLFTTLILGNAAQTASLLIRPFSPGAFRKINRAIADFWWGLCDQFAEHIYRIKINFTGDDVPEKENALVMVNHQEMADITVLFRLARRKKRLGDMKWFVKDILKYVPGVGWGMLFLDCLFIKRNWTTDKKKVHKVFETLLNNHIPVWLISFVEGTRVRPQKVEQSRQYALKTGRKPLDHLLIPRSKGFVASVENLRGHLDAVYDVTIGYVEGVPTLWQWIKGYVKQANIHVRRYAMVDMPKGEKALEAWLATCFEEKDLLLEQYYATGAFPE